MKHIKTISYTTILTSFIAFGGTVAMATTPEQDALLEEMFQKAMTDLKDPAPITEEAEPAAPISATIQAEAPATTTLSLTEAAAQPSTTSFTEAPIPQAPAMADRIIATVNDTPITEGDVGSRLALTLRQLGVQSLPEDRKPAFIQRTLAELIEETLKLNYAKAKGLNVTNEEVLQAIRQIEMRNNMPAGGYVRLVAGLESEAKKKLFAEILWRKAVERFVAPQVVISNKEVDRLIQQMLQHKKLVEREVAQIYLPHTENRTDAEAHILLQEILTKLKNGEDFATLAKTYSEDDAARRGGVLGWFAVGEMMPELEKAATNLEPGEVSGAIRTDAGWHIIRVLQTRTSNAVNIDPIEQVKMYEFSTKLIGVPEEDKKTIEALKSFAFKARKKEDPTALATDTISVKDENWQPITAYPEAIQPELNDPRLNRLTPVVTDDATNTARVWLLKATRLQTAPQLQEYRDRVKKRLMQQRVELEERRLIRDLKANAYVDMKPQE